MTDAAPDPAESPADPPRESDRERIMRLRAVPVHTSSHSLRISAAASSSADVPS